MAEGKHHTLDFMRRLRASALESHGEEPIGLLAEVRRIDLGTSDAEPEEEVARLERAGHTPVLGLSLYARATLAHVLAERHEIDAALAELTRLSYETPAPELTPHLTDDIDAVLGLAAHGRRGDRARRDRLLDLRPAHRRPHRVAFALGRRPRAAADAG